jgi:hypothetical protein
MRWHWHALEGAKPVNGFGRPERAQPYTVFLEGFNLNFGVTEPAYRQGSTLSCGPCTLENLLHLATGAATPDTGQATNMTALRQRQALAIQSGA